MIDLDKITKEMFERLGFSWCKIDQAWEKAEPIESYKFAGVLHKEIAQRIALDAEIEKEKAVSKETYSWWDSEISGGGVTYDEWMSRDGNMHAKRLAELNKMKEEL